MQRVLTGVSSTQPHETRVWVAVLLVAHFFSFVQGWNVNGPHVPVSSCQTPLDCAAAGWTVPLPACEDSRCICPSGSCVVYTNANYDFLFFCGSCGMLGSTCDNTTDCMMDWLCVKGFCECNFGSMYDGVCMYYESIPAAITTVVLISILIFIIMLQNLIRSRKKLKQLCCTPSNESDDDQISRIVASNPQSNEKSAAFTITNPDFITTEEDPDLAWAFELSHRLAEGGELDATTLSSTMSSSVSDPRLTAPCPPQPSTSGWREPRSEPRSQRRSSNSSLSSTSSSQHHSSSSFDTTSSYSSSSYSSSPPSTSQCSSLTSETPSFPSSVSDVLSCVTPRT